ncbi:oligosaccharide flippase family protein [Flavobacterium sp. LPB0248]|uniref:oligosaccharide flippase family protein n=1 Tax=Flavobacterium sp. LPB0248 TaxID=2614441 RepID=UPI0015A4FE5B|nr:oligosaccharide flippase family protein [Flavobacterium sp. LPB0248]QLC65612.1 oligosaccharide flippase family protein [Flavobacterium sp. LPB0248]
MSDNKASYQQILKATSILGSVQFLTILFSVIRTKIIAVFIGPSGMGIIALLNSTLNLIGGVTGLGIETSAIKSISENYKDDNIKSVSKIAEIVKKIMFFAGIFGAFLTIVFSKWISILSFGNDDQMYALIFLSITLIFKQLTSSQMVVLQGLRKLKLLAKANLYGNLFGLLFSIPIYYFFRIDAIVPTIILSSFIALVFSFYYASKIRLQKENIDTKQLLSEGKSIVKLGIMLTVSSLLTLLSAYLTQIYISNVSSTEQVGLYSAGFTLLNSYVGIIFTVMSTDYYPRLAAINSDNTKIRTVVLQQSYISILIITPIIVLFLTFVPFIIKALYTSKFIVIVSMVCFGIVGMLFRAVSFAMGYILIAKGDAAMFTKTAIAFNTLSLALNIVGYYFYGLEGLGISFLIYSVFHFFALKLITKKNYDFYLNKKISVTFSICFLLCIASFFARYIELTILRSLLMGILCMIAIAYFLYEMNREIYLKEIVSAVFRNNKKES